MRTVVDAMDIEAYEDSSDEERRLREAGLDDTIAATFPASDPPSSLPNPDLRDGVSDGAPPGSIPE
jgi:hypothetical protein